MATVDGSGVGVGVDPGVVETTEAAVGASVGEISVVGLGDRTGAGCSACCEGHDVAANAITATTPKSALRVTVTLSHNVYIVLKAQSRALWHADVAVLHLVGLLQN